MMLVAYRLFTGRSKPVPAGIGLGLLAIAQFLISSEVLVVTAVVGAVGLAATALWAPRQIAATWKPVGTALGVALGVAGAGLAFPAWFALAGPQHIVGSPWPGIQIEGNRLASVVVAGRTGSPNTLLELGGYEGPAGPPGAYLGLSVVILCIASAGLAWRRRTTRILGTAAAATLVLSLGAVLWTIGTSLHGRLWLPWKVVGSLPILDQVGPQRFTALVDLLVATVIALGVDACWLATASWRSAPGGPGTDQGASAGERIDEGGTGRRRRGPGVAIGCGLVALCVAALVPLWSGYHAPLTTRSVGRPAWLASVLSPTPRAPIDPVLLVYPFPMSATLNARPLVWQAVSSMGFGLAGGYVKVPGPGGRALVLGAPRSPQRLLATLSIGTGHLPAPAPWQIDALRSEVASSGTTAVVVTRAGRAPAYTAELFTAALGRAPSRSAGAWTWDLARPPTRATASTSPGRAASAVANCRTLTGPEADRWATVGAVSRCIVAQARL